MIEEHHEEELKQSSFEEGREEERKTIARALLASGADVANVAKLTQLSQEQIQKLADSGAIDQDGSNN
ncbi:hypothetical protein KFU94_46160 [Chloroflexi bacterium TSY]|nr:hypothetical protein [Chloroflexi bacterium TSY]